MDQDLVHSVLLDLTNSKKNSTDNNVRILPASKEALCQHIYRASYQDGYLWRQSVEELDIPDPEQCGWKTYPKGDFRLLWTTSQSSVTVKNFIATCSRKSGKCKNSKFVRANVACLSMCGCGRGCICTLITLYISVFVDKLKEIPFSMSIYNSLSFWFIAR